MIHTPITYKTCNLDPIELQSTDYKAYSSNTFTKQIYPLDSFFQPLGYKIVEWILYMMHACHFIYILSYVYICISYVFHMYFICILPLCGFRLFKFKR